MRYTTGLEAVAQALRISLLSFKGEWFANLDNGVPYLEREGVTATEALLGQRYSADKVNAAFRTVIAGTTGVTEILSLAVEFVTSTRTSTVSFEVRTDFGVITVDELEF